MPVHRPSVGAHHVALIAEQPDVGTLAVLVLEDPGHGAPQDPRVGSAIRADAVGEEGQTREGRDGHLIARRA